MSKLTRRRSSLKTKTMSLLLVLVGCGGQAQRSGYEDGEKVEKPIGESGGELQLHGGVRLGVPVGALDGPVALSVTRLDAESEANLAAPPTKGASSVSPLVALQPHGQKFDTPVTVSLPLETGGERIFLLRLEDETDTQWEVLDTPLSIADGLVTFEVSEFSVYGAFDGCEGAENCPTDQEETGGAASGGAASGGAASGGTASGGTASGGTASGGAATGGAATGGTGGGGQADCADGSWDHDALSATACVPWSTCKAGFGTPGTPTADRECGDTFWRFQSGTSGEDHGHAVVVAPDGGYYVAGATMGAFPGQTPVGSSDAFVSKYSNDNILLWTRQFGSTGADSATSLGVSSEGDIFVAGSTDTLLDPATTELLRGNGFLRKYASDGTLLWEKIIGTQAQDRIEALVIGEGDVIYLGGAGGDFDNPTAQTGAGGLLHKYDTSGAVQWMITTGWEIADLTLDSNGDVLSAGSQFNGFWDVAHSRHTAEGVPVWSDVFGDLDVDSGNAVTTGPGNTSFVVGTYTSPTDFLPYGFLKKYDSLGSEVWTQDETVTSRTSRVFLSPAGDLFTMGTATGNTYLRQHASDGQVVSTTPLDESGGTTVADHVISQNVVYFVGTTNAALPGHVSEGARDFVVGAYPL